MLIEFRVKNFRSFRDEQVFSLVASADKTLRDSNSSETHIKAAQHVLHSAVIYGANASGKSNLIKAIQLMRGAVRGSTQKQPNHPWNAQPFRLDEATAQQPSEFEITFLLAGVRYQYGFALTTQRITHEYLLAYKTAKPQRWFERTFDDNSKADIYEFGAGLQGAKSVWQQATRADTLFLSTAVQLNSDALRPIFHWLTKELIIINELEHIHTDFTVSQLKYADTRQQICQFMQAADISLEDIVIKTKNVKGISVEFNADSDSISHQQIEKEEDILHFVHKTNQGSATFALEDESSGTRHLLFLIAPILNILKNGETLIVDELDTSLHPLLMRELVRLFHQPETNRTGAQLIFSTHDTSLLDAGILRRDQVWFVEKNQAQSSELSALSDFSPRKQEAFERSYLTGRYGGIPFLQPLLGVQ